MLIYEVNAAIDADTAAKYRKWLKPHIEEVLTCEGFVKAEWFEVEASGAESATDRVHITVHYYVHTRKHLEAYFQDHAPELRAEGIKLFGDKFATSRRILTPIAD